MPLYTSLAALSQTAASNAPDGSVDLPSTVDDQLRFLGSFIAQLRDGKGITGEVDVASGATCDIGAANSPFVRVTGTTNITSFGTNYNGPRFLRFTGLLSLSNSSTLVLPGGATIAVQVGDSCIAVPMTGGGWRVTQYQRAATAPDVHTTSSSNNVKLPGGLILQWGTTGNINAGSNALVTYPIPFPSTVFVVTANALTLIDGTTASSAVIQLIDVTQMRLHNYMATSSATFNWLAIGV